MHTTVAQGYLPVDLLGIGSTPLMLFCVAIAIVVIGVVTSGLMSFVFKVGVLKVLAVLVLALVASSAAAWFAYDGYHKTAASNLASNIAYKYPKLKLESPESVIDGYLKLSSTKANQPLEAVFLNGAQKLTYRLDASKGAAEPVLSPADKSSAPNPIEFARAGETK